MPRASQPQLSQDPNISQVKTVLSAYHRSKSCLDGLYGHVGFSHAFLSYIQALDLLHARHDNHLTLLNSARLC